MRFVRLFLGGFRTAFFRRLNIQLINCKTILDVGCCDNSIIKYVILPKDFTGVEIDYNYYLKAKKNGLYKDVILGDMELVLEDLLERNVRFDCVLLSDVVEHVSKKKALRVLRLAEKVALKKVIVYTPLGKMEQIDRLKKESKYQVHRCFFYPDEFISLGFNVEVLDNFSIKSIYAFKEV